MLKRSLCHICFFPSIFYFMHFFHWLFLVRKRLNKRRSTCCNFLTQHWDHITIEQSVQSWLFLTKIKLFSKQIRLHHHSFLFLLLFGLNKSVAIGCEHALGNIAAGSGFSAYRTISVRRWGEISRKSGDDKARPLADLTFACLAQLLAQIQRASSHANKSVQK